MGNQLNKTTRGKRAPLPKCLANSGKSSTPMLFDILSIVHENIKKIETRRLRFRNVENFIVIWLDSSINEMHGDIQHSITKLRNIVNSIKKFIDPEKCVNFMNDIQDEKIFLIVSGSLGRQFIPRIENMTQIDSIYIFCTNKTIHEQWAKQYKKIAGVFIKIESICNRLKENIRQYEFDSMSISILPNPSTVDTNQLDQTFMYSQLLKEVLLELEYSDNAKKEFVDFCRKQYADNQRELLIINEFEEKYEQSLSIQWYTRECFVYSMLNKALRTQDIEIIMRMGYFIRDLHHQIKELHSQSDNSYPFIVYRGQGLPNDEFEKLKTSKGYLLAFNNFLSTSTMREISLIYARRAQRNSDLIAILFHMKIDPTISSTPFASLDNVSFYSNGEKEILFSMHTIFRIGDIEQLEDRLWEVNLTLTSENDQHLTYLSEYIRKEIDGKTNFHRIGALMIEMGQFDKAEEIYSLLLEKISDKDLEEQATIHHQLGYIMDEKGDLTTAKCHYDCSLSIRLNYLLADDPRLSTTYSSIGMILRKQGHLDAALKNFEHALKLDLHGSPPDELKIAIRYNNIGLVLKDQGKYFEALKEYKRALDIFCRHSPTQRPDLATLYNNIGMVHDSLGDKLKALSYYEETLAIERKSVPTNHPTLAITHHHIATVLKELQRYDESLEHSRKAVNIAGQTFKSDHSQMQTYQNFHTQLLSKVRWND